MFQLWVWNFGPRSNFKLRRWNLQVSVRSSTFELRKRNLEVRVEFRGWTFEVRTSSRVFETKERTQQPKKTEKQGIIKMRSDLMGEVSKRWWKGGDVEL